MYKWENAVLTMKGQTLLAKLTSGHTLSLIRAVTGAGYVLHDNLKYQSGVTDEKQELEFSGRSYPEEGMCAVSVQLLNTNLPAGYTANQVGIYAMDPDEGEILFLIAQADGGEGTDIPSETEMPGYSAEWTFYLKYGQADGVTVTVDTATTEMVRSILQEHSSDTNNPHAVTKEQLGLDNVDNTADNDKYVAYAQRAGSADKTKYALTVRLNGGRTENTDMWTFDGSTSRTVNVTAAKIGAEPAIEDTSSSGCYYRMVDGEKEWLNPPIHIETEVRTTERFMDQPVYTKLLNLGEINTAENIFENNIGGILIRSEAVVHNTNGGQRFTAPVIEATNDGVKTLLAVSVSSDTIKCYNDLQSIYSNAQFKLYVRVWYYKVR